LNKFYADFQPKVQQARELIPQSRSRYLGDDDTGRPVSVIVNLKYGPSIAIGLKGRPDTAYYSANIDPDVISTITLEEALSLASSIKSNPLLSKQIVSYDRNGTNYSITIKPPAKGRDTHYFEFEGVFYSVLDTINVANITSIDIDKCIEAKRLKASAQLHDFQDFKVLNGTFGPYISVPNKISKGKPVFISINTKLYDVTKLTKDDCIVIIANSPKKYAYKTSTTEAGENSKSKKEKTTKKTPSKKIEKVTSSATEEETAVVKKRSSRSTKKSDIPDDTPIDSSVPKKRKSTKKPEV